MTYYANRPVLFAGVSQVTASLGTNDPEVGARSTVGDEEYVFVYNAGTTQISPGFGAVMSLVTGYSVTVSSVTQVDFLVGVCKHNTLTTATYGWLVTRGFIAVEMAPNNSVAAGGLLAIGVDGGFSNQLISTGNVAPAVGKAVSAIASGGSGSAFINVH